MGAHEQEQATPAPAPAPTAPVVEVAAPVAPVPLPAQGLVVGHAADRAEADADRMADSALSRLARRTGETHQHGPGCDHVAGGQVRRLPSCLPSTLPSTFGVVRRTGDQDKPASSVPQAPCATRC